MNYAAGTVTKLTADIAVTIGKVANVTLHPSGTQYDGPAVVVAAYLGTLGAPMVNVVSLSDPAGRIVAKGAAEFADA